MSGICGIVSLDDTSPTATEINAIAAGLDKRGPDGTHVWLHDGVALGHTSLATTPEALVETLPLTDDGTGCTITADVRLDNRETLIAALDLAGETRTIGDGELILRAYLQWGERCPAHLLGDFAFAIWDPRSKVLFCARDHMGMRQLLYRHDADRQFIFATDALAIVAHPEVEAPLNQERIGDFLSNMEGADLTSTFFRNVYRLPPAHSLMLECGAVAMRAYWQLEVEPELRLPSDEAYADAFLNVLTEAVRCRLRSTGRIGAMLSGGIDSNAVVAVATRLRSAENLGPLPTFSAVGPDPSNCIETRTIMKAMTATEIAPTAVDHAALSLFREDLIRETVASAEPFDGHMALIRAVYLAARREQINVVLDGVMGDVALASNFHTAFLLREGRIVRAWRELVAQRQLYGPQAFFWRGVISTVWRAFAPFPMRKARFLAGRRKFDRAFAKRTAQIAPHVHIGSALERRRTIQRRDAGYLRMDGMTHLRLVTHPNSVVARERYDRVAAALGIEPRDPFLDIRLLRFCLSLPRAQRERKGWSKWILRHAMSCHLPAEITWRVGKEHLGAIFIAAIQSDLQSDTTNCDGRAVNAEFSQMVETVYLSNWFASMERYN